MKRLFFLVLAVCFTLTVVHGQYDPSVCGFYTTNGNEIPCGQPQKCCNVSGACNGPDSPFQNYDPDYGATAGCAIPPPGTPLDSGALFLLMGGAIFGGMMITRRRKDELHRV